jgi:molecular chaperone GrpE
LTKLFALSLQAGLEINCGIPICDRSLWSLAQMEEQKPGFADSSKGDENPTKPAEIGLSTNPETSPAASEDTVERMPDTAELLRLAELKAAEHHDAWLRAKAETENMRRRAQEDIARASKYAIEKFAEALLPVKDTLEMALADQNPDSMRTGVELTLKNLVAAFEKGGLKEENPVGQKFDPNKHQSIAIVEAEQEPNSVVSVLQKGYLIGDRTLRPAMVTIAKAKAQ